MNYTSLSPTFYIHAQPSHRSIRLNHKKNIFFFRMADVEEDGSYHIDYDRDDESIHSYNIDYGSEHSVDNDSQEEQRVFDGDIDMDIIEEGEIEISQEESIRKNGFGFCCVCMEECSRIFTLQGKPATLEDLSIYTKTNSFHGNALIFPSCCQLDHGVCTNCLVNLGTRFLHTLTLETFQCHERTLEKKPCPGIFDTFEMTCILDPLQMRNLRARKQQITNQPVLKTCSLCFSTQKIPLHIFKDHIPGELFISCVHCTHVFCFDCDHPQQESSSVCVNCHVSAWHTSYPRVELDKIEMVKQNKINYKMIVDYTHQIIENGIFVLRCFDCGTPLERIDKCNVLSHCSREICYLCGESSLPYQKLPSSHWHDYRKKDFRCSRYIESTSLAAFLSYQCSETTCSNTSMYCHNPHHRKGIQNLELLRLALHLHSIHEQYEKHNHMEIPHCFPKDPLLRHMAMHRYCAESSSASYLCAVPDDN